MKRKMQKTSARENIWRTFYIQKDMSIIDISFNQKKE